MMRSWRLVPALLLTLPLAMAAPAAAERPDLRVTVVEDGLEQPWDLDFLPDRSMLVTERDSKRLLLRSPGGKLRTLFTAPRHMWSGGETGLMSVEVADDFSSSRAFITCHGYRRGGTQDVRVVRWRLNKARTGASYVTGGARWPPDRATSSSSAPATPPRVATRNG
jgi:glucose/arabinose dehydrogenase